MYAIGVVDVEGKTWRIIEFPSSEDCSFIDTAPGDIDMSQGQLHLTTCDDITGDKLAIWVLEDHENEEWTLKHAVSFQHLLGKKYAQFGYYEYTVITIHPDRNILFLFFDGDKTIMSYDMDCGKVSTIYNLESNCSGDYFIPYVPLFSESLADGQQ